MPATEPPPTAVAAREADDTLRLYAILRSDLAMPPGKLVAQGGHAYTDALDEARRRDPARAAAYDQPGGGTKVALAAPSLATLERAYEACLAAGIPCALIVDAHHVLPPHFDGSPIVTALGIGPARRREVHSITKRFRSLA